MPKISLSFGVAIGIHIIILLLSSFLIDKRPVIDFNSRNLIDVQFGNRAIDEVRSYPKKSPLKTISSEKKSLTSTETATQLISENKIETKTGAGISSENNFEASVVNYQGPIYPRIAQVRGLQGNVRIRITVSEEGLPKDINILQSSGHEVLDKAALEVIPHWRFQKKNLPYYVEKNIIFQLKD